MIQASRFSQNCGLLKDMTSKFKVPVSHEKESLYFLSGDPTYYGHKSLKMCARGYEIIKQAIMDPANHSLPEDPNGFVASREAVARHISSSNPTVEKVSADNVILTHGANMGLFNLLLSILNPGDNILVPEPGYPFFHLTGQVSKQEGMADRLRADCNVRQWEWRFVHTTQMRESSLRSI